MSFDSAALTEALTEALSKAIAKAMTETSAVKLGWWDKVFANLLNLISLVFWIYDLAVLSRQTWQHVRDWCFRLDEDILPLVWGLASAFCLYLHTELDPVFGIGTIGLFIFALALSWETSVCHTLLRINKETDHRMITLLVHLSLSMAVFAARSCVGLIAFLLYVLAGRLDRIKIFDNGYRVAMSIYVLLDIMLALMPIFIIRNLSAKSNLKLSTRAILAMGSVACLATLLIVPVELDHPGTMDEFVNDWFFEIGSVFLGKEMVDGLSLVFMLYPLDLETLLQF